jgi:N-formylmaleamate deformylase
MPTVLSDYSQTALATGDVTIQSYRLHKNKPALLLLHGFTDAAVCWNRVLPILEPDFDLLLIDTRGHGRSTELGRDLHYDLQVDDVVQVLAGLDVKHVGILGHSMGAMVGSMVAARFPHLVDFLILEDPPLRADLVYTPSDDQFPDPANSWHQTILTLRQSSQEDAIKFAKTAHNNWDDVEIRAWVESKRQLNLSVFNKPIDDYPVQWREVYSRIVCPTLLVTGEIEKEALVTPQVANEVCSLLKNGQVAHIRGAGHSIRRDQFNRFIDSISAFLADLAPYL